MNGYQRALDDVGHHSFDEQGRRLTVERIAERMDESPTRLRKALSAYDDTHPLNAAKVVPLTHATGNKALVRYFCEATGGFYVELPKVNDTNHQDVVRQSEVLIKEFGEALAKAGLAVADGHVSRQDAEEFGKEADDVVAAILQFKELMNRKAGISTSGPRRVESA